GAMTKLRMMTMGTVTATLSDYQPEGSTALRLRLRRVGMASHLFSSTVPTNGAFLTETIVNERSFHLLSVNLVTGRLFSGVFSHCGVQNENRGGVHPVACW